MKKYLSILMLILFSQMAVALETTSHLDLFDKSRNRMVPIDIYSDNIKNTNMPLVIINHGYGAKNTEYSFLADALAGDGYFAVSIQHDLETDAALPRTGNLYERRKPLWERGVQNILFVLEELKHKYSQVDYNNITLVGHSNGGDMSMLLAKEYPN